MNCGMRRRACADDAKESGSGWRRDERMSCRTRPTERNGGYGPSAWMEEPSNRAYETAVPASRSTEKREIPGADSEGRADRVATLRFWTVGAETCAATTTGWTISASGAEASWKPFPEVWTGDWPRKCVNHPPSAAPADPANAWGTTIQIVELTRSRTARPCCR